MLGTIRTVLHRVFLSDSRRNLTLVARAKRDDACERYMATRSPTATCSFVGLRALVDAHHSQTRPMPSHVPAELVVYIHKLVVHVKRVAVQRGLPVKQNTACMTYGILQLLSTGFCPMRVFAVPRVSFVSAHGITPSQYAKLPGLRARQQSISVRQLQRICVDEDGRTVTQFPDVTPSLRAYEP